MGFDAVFMARMDRHDKDYRLKGKTMEFVWRPSSALGSKNELLAHLLIDHYRSPTGLGFDILDHQDQWTVDNGATEAKKMNADF